MTQPQPAVQDPGLPTRVPLWQHVLAAAAVAAQGLVLVGTFPMILGWFDVWFVLALAQAGAGLALAAAWLPRRPLRALGVPPLSLLLTVALFAVANLQARTFGCSGDEMVAAGRLAPPPGGDVQFHGEMSPEGCVARFSSDLSTPGVLDHYEAELQRHGWTVLDRSDHGELAAARGDHILTVWSSAEEGGRVTVTIGDRPDDLGR